MNSKKIICKVCENTKVKKILDLGAQPPSNSYVGDEKFYQPENIYPLNLFLCKKCLHLFSPSILNSQDIFSDYKYFSSFSKSWLAHAKSYVNHIIKFLNLNKQSLVYEIASNDGYLLKNFKNTGIDPIGIEPATNVAKESIIKGINTINDFFTLENSKKIKKKYGPADLIIANNVIAHVPNINDFVEGMNYLLKDKGTITIEFPSVYNLIKSLQFDTIYHEHFSYYSLLGIEKLLKIHGLKIYHVEKIKTHGGSYRVYATKNIHLIKKTIDYKNLRKFEIEKGLIYEKFYMDFERKVFQIKKETLNFLIKLKRVNKKIIGYGAAAKANTFINYCGIKGDLIDFIVDKNIHKVGNYLPGSRIPIKNVSSIKKYQPDYIVIFPWNLSEEIVKQLEFVRSWNCKILVFVPKLKYL